MFINNYYDKKLKVKFERKVVIRKTENIKVHKYDYFKTNNSKKNVIKYKTSISSDQKKMFFVIKLTLFFYHRKQIKMIPQ